MKILKKNRGGGIWFRGGRGGGVDVNEELKFLGKLKKKMLGGGGGRVGEGGVNMDVNEELKFL